MAAEYNENGGLYYRGEVYPPQVYHNVVSDLEQDILLSSRDCAKKNNVGKTFVCNLRNKILDGLPAAPKPRGGNNPAVFQEPELDYLLSLYNVCSEQTSCHLHHQQCPQSQAPLA